MIKRIILGIVLTFPGFGCLKELRVNHEVDSDALRDLAFEGLRRGITYPDLASVRSQAVESLEKTDPNRGLSWIRSALHDSHPGVQFAACMALGQLRDEASLENIRPWVHGRDGNLCVAAIFFLHRIGIASETHRLPDFLLNHDDPAVRANAALVLGRLREPGAVKLMARVMMREKNEAVRLQTLESLALLGNEEGIEQLIFLAPSDGAVGAFALGALGQLEDPRFQSVLRSALQTSIHMENRLIAVRWLGELGVDRGYQLCVDVLVDTEGENVKGTEQDPAWNQRMRQRQLAALALGSIGRREALPHLESVLRNPNDPRVQVAAARAILDIVGPAAKEDHPFGT